MEAVARVDVGAVADVVQAGGPADVHISIDELAQLRGQPGSACRRRLPLADLHTGWRAVLLMGNACNTITIRQTQRMLQIEH